MNAEPETDSILNYTHLIHTMDSETFCDMISDHTEMLSEALSVEAAVVEKSEGVGMPHTLKHKILHESKKRVDEIVRKGSILRNTMVIAQDVFNLDLRLQRVTGMRMPIIDLMIECLIASTYHVNFAAINREYSKTYQVDGVPYRLRHLDSKLMTDMNVTMSEYLAKVRARRTTTQEKGHLNPNDTGILHNLLLMHYISGQLKRPQ